jgi:hypothetical protein
VVKKTGDAGGIQESRAGKLAKNMIGSAQQ